MLKTIGSSEVLEPKSFRAGNNEVVKGGGYRANTLSKNLSKSKKLKNDKSEILTNIGAIKKPIFLISSIRKVFN